jgi:hypothetical protein
MKVKGNIQSNSSNEINSYLVDSGSANAYAVTLIPAITAYTTGLKIVFQAVNANTTTSTLAVNGLTAKTIKKNVSSNLDANDIMANGIYEVIYDGTNFQFLGTFGSSNAPRVNGTTSSTTPTPNADTTDIYSLTALAAGATFGAPTGTPVNGQKLIIRIKDNGGAQTLAWNAIYVAGGVALPTTTVAGKIAHYGFQYNNDNALNKWQLIAKSEES